MDGSPLTQYTPTAKLPVLDTTLAVTLVDIRIVDSLD
jgi:hypothetical protein